MLAESEQRRYLSRIENALHAATEIASRYAPGTFEVQDHGGRNVVTEVDRRVSDVLRAQLLGAGGTSNPATGEIFLGALNCGVTRNGQQVFASTRKSLQGAHVLASRSEYKRGEWQRFEGAGFNVQPLGSVAYKLSLVAAGMADATWTLCPKHEWDIAAGVALVAAGGGCISFLNDAVVQLNREVPLLPGLVGSGSGVWRGVC